MLRNKDKRLIIELICNEQTHMIMKHPESYDSDKYRHLEELKVKIKEFVGFI